MGKHRFLSGLLPGSAPEPAPPPAEGELARLFREHNDSLVQLLRARLRSDQEARDVAQEAYVRLLQLDRIGTISYLRTYLFRTAINIATDRLRSQAVRRTGPLDPVFDRIVDELSPDRTAQAEQALHTVAATLNTLPPKIRYAFMLHRFAELEMDEIARRVGVSERMVRRYLLTALRSFHDAIEGVGSP